MCHKESRLLDSKEPERMQRSEYAFEAKTYDYQHIEVHLIQVVPHLLQGDRLGCNKKHSH